MFVEVADVAVAADAEALAPPRELFSLPPNCAAAVAAAEVAEEEEEEVAGRLSAAVGFLCWSTYEFHFCVCVTVFSADSSVSVSSSSSDTRQLFLYCRGGERRETYDRWKMH